MDSGFFAVTYILTNGQTDRQMDWQTNFLQLLMLQYISSLSLVTSLN